MAKARRNSTENDLFLIFVPYPFSSVPLTICYLNLLPSFLRRPDSSPSFSFVRNIYIYIHIYIYTYTYLVTGEQQITVRTVLPPPGRL
jgi:hypothetical protein